MSQSIMATGDTLITRHKSGGSMLCCPICQNQKIFFYGPPRLDQFPNGGKNWVFDMSCDNRHNFLFIVGADTSQGLVGLYAYYNPSQLEHPLNYQDYISSQEWKEKARGIKEKRGSVCQLCGRTGNGHELHVHHNNYKNLGHELDSDLIVLCADCHAKFHDKAVI